MKHINELLGLPQGYMELHDGFSFVRFTYRTVRWRFDTEKQAQDFVERLMAEIKFLLPEDGTIIWREKPSVHRNIVQYMVYTRFATSPPLPEEFWKTYQVNEGIDTPEWKNFHIPSMLRKRTDG